MFKECFLGYVNAGMLEPILAIASSDYDVTTRSLLINLAQLLGLFSWLYLLSDAFDISDTQQAFIYWDRIGKGLSEKARPAWLRKARSRHGREGAELRGSLLRDLALWFMLFCSLSAFFGIVSHRDVIHSHAVVILWAFLHHQSRSATAWRGTGYMHTFFTPSSALLPLVQRAREPSRAHPPLDRASPARASPALTARASPDRASAAPRISPHA